MKNPLNNIKNIVWHGLALGLIIPGVLGVISWYIIHHVKALSRADLLYIGCIAVNALLMQYFFKQNKENAGKGVLSATFICAFIFYFYKVL